MHTLAQLQSGALKGSTFLKLSEGLSYFPEEIFDLADTLEVLDLSGNQMEMLPKHFGRLSKLRVLFCSNNLFTVLPAVLGDCPLLDIAGFKACHIQTIPERAINPNLRWLILTDNRITALPKEIGHCMRMQKLMLAGNRLTYLPHELQNCHNLALLRISANQLESLPAWLLSMPRLSWLAFAGNKFSITHSNNDLPCIHWSSFDVYHTLGEGASGIIYKGVQRDGNVLKDVAVKLFKGTVTSDGSPEDEMNAFIAAGHHNGLVKLIGQVAGHPDGRHGLVMELIDPVFYTLGQPPSLASCTRDVFTQGQSLTAVQAMKIAATIASVAEQLHSKGIMHGDLYAHNTLVDSDGHALLSDFGAASFYDKKDIHTAACLERIEVSAFGHLLDDLITLCNGDTGQKQVQQLKILREACVTQQVLLRPSFSELVRKLEEIS